MIEDRGEPYPPIRLEEVSSSVLSKVIEYCEHHRNDPVHVQDETDDLQKHSNDIEEWDMKFMQVDQEMLFDVILAANYLDIQPLVDVGCKTVGGLINGKTPNDIRRRFNIVNNFTPEEEAWIRRENEWAEDR